VKDVNEYMKEVEVKDVNEYMKEAVVKLKPGILRTHKVTSNPVQA